MKLKNIKVGDKLEVKKSIVDDPLNSILTAGDIVEVKFVEPESYEGCMTVYIIKNGDNDWVSHKHLRKPRNTDKPKIGDEYMVVSVGEGVTKLLGVGTRHTILREGLCDCSFTLDSRFIATPVGDDRLEIRGLNTFLEKVRDKPKALDQSVFDGLDEKWQFAAIDANGNTYVYMSEPSISGRYFVGGNGADYELVGESYDTSNWQDSLISRNTTKLTGSDLTRKMLADGVTEIECYVSDESDEEAVNDEAAADIGVRTVTGFSNGQFQTNLLFDWKCAVPVSSASSAPRNPKPLSRWQHRNGGIYTVTDIANQDSEYQDRYPVTIVYKGKNGKTWSRPLSEWHRSMTEIED